METTRMIALTFGLTASFIWMGGALAADDDDHPQEMGTPAQRNGPNETKPGFSLGAGFSYGGIGGLRADTPLEIPMTDEGNVDLLGVIDMANAGVETWTEKRDGSEIRFDLNASYRIPSTHLLASGTVSAGRIHTEGEVVPAGEQVTLLEMPDTEDSERSMFVFDEKLSLWRQGNLTDHSRDGRVRRGAGALLELPSYSRDYGATTVSAGAIGPTYGTTALLIEPAIWTFLSQDPSDADHMVRVTLETGIDTERTLMFSMPSRFSFASRSLIPKSGRDNGEDGLGDLALSIYTEPRICPVIGRTLICASVYADGTLQSAGTFSQAHGETGAKLSVTVLPAQ